MRVAAIRTDIQKVYLNDIENTSQRCFSSEPAGQSRYLSKPTDAMLATVLATYGVLSAKGATTTATVDTTGGANILRIRTKSTAAYSVIAVTIGATTSKVQIAADLNVAFTNLGLTVKATVLSGADANKIQLDTTVGGPSAFLQIDTAANGSTLNALLNAAWAAAPPNLTGLSVAALKAAVYPTATTVNVASATITALSTFATLQASASAALVTAVQDTVAPNLVETGPVLLSFAYGALSKLRSATYQPGAARIGLAAGAAVAIVANDGSTAFTL